MKRLPIILGAAAVVVAGLAGCADKTTNYHQTPVGRIYSEHSRNPGDSTVFRADNQGNLIEAGYIDRLTGKVIVSYWANKGGIPPHLKATYEAMKNHPED